MDGDHVCDQAVVEGEDAQTHFASPCFPSFYGPGGYISANADLLEWLQIPSVIAEVFTVDENFYNFLKVQQFSCSSDIADRLGHHRF